MNSINEIAKYKYEFNNNSPVNLDEYIILYDEALNEKYLLFKLYNSISEKLKHAECQVKIYNENNFLIEDIKFAFDGEFDGSSYLVPENKLKVNSNITSIKFNITYLEFETLKFEDGEIRKIPQTLDDFMASPENEVIPVKKANKWTKKTDKLKYKTTKKNVKKDNKRRYVTDVIKENKTKIHIVWTTIFSIIVIGYFIASMLLYGITAKIKSDGSCDYVTNGNALTLVDNYRVNSNISVPKAIDGVNVTKIAKDAFRGNTTLQTLTLNYYVEIGEGAFNGCTNLRTINNSHFITKIEKDAFTNTPLNLINFQNCGYVAPNAFPTMTVTDVKLPKSTLTSNSLNGITGVTSIEYDRLEASTSLYSVFGNQYINTLTNVLTYNDISYTALEGFNNIQRVYLYGENTTMRSSYIDNRSLTYLRLNVSTATIKERFGVTDGYKFKYLHLNNANTNVNFLYGIGADVLVIDSGTLETNFLAGTGEISKLYIGKNVDCSRADFSKIVNTRIREIYFEGQMPQNARNYVSTGYQNTLRSTLGIDA